jgi:hypothetical protein
MSLICAVALALVLDGSGSMQQDFHTQREETARAIESPQVVEAIQRQGAIAISVHQFASTVRVEVPWQILRTEADARVLATHIRAVRFLNGRDTYISRALASTTQYFDELNDCIPEQQIIDLSTDGIDPGVQAVAEARDAAIAAGIRINVIAVGEPEDADVLREYAMTPDGFVLHTTRWSEYPALFRRKIILELASTYHGSL